MPSPKPTKKRTVACAMPKKQIFERLEARISPEKKSLFKHAADLSGRSLTDFIVSAASEVASRVIQEQRQIVLSLKDHTAFIEALSTPPAPANSLLKAIKTYKKDVIPK